MFDTTLIIDGFGLLFQWSIPVAIISGMMLGLVIGVIPGMTAALGLAVVLPLTFQLEAVTALILMTSIYTGSLTGGGILAILINTPGTPGAVATTFDGYPMTKAGRHNEALGLQIAASVIGGLASYIALLFFIRPMTWIALQFGPSEMLALTVFVLLIVGVLGGRYLARSLFAGLLGMLLSTVGTSLETGTVRGTMGFTELEDGLPLILCIIGMFAIPEMIQIVTRSAISEHAIDKAQDLGRLKDGARMACQATGTWIRGALIGIFVGLLPAAGATLASLLSYSTAKRLAKPGQRFGEGEPTGVVAAESANNASEGGAMAILLALGIPGSASTAVILGAFLLHGLVPGGGLMRDNGALVYGLILGNIAQMLVLGAFALLVAFYVVRIVIVPSKLLVPFLLLLLTLGAYSYRDLLFDVAVVYVFGMIGWFFRRYHFNLLSLMIGLFLGRQMDEEIIRFAILFGDRPLEALARPITSGLCVLIVLTLGVQVSRWVRPSAAAVGGETR